MAKQDWNVPNKTAPHTCFKRLVFLFVKLCSLNKWSEDIQPLLSTLDIVPVRHMPADLYQKGTWMSLAGLNFVSARNGKGELAISSYTSHATQRQTSAQFGLSVPKERTARYSWRSSRLSHLPFRVTGFTAFFQRSLHCEADLPSKQFAVICQLPFAEPYMRTLRLVPCKLSTRQQLNAASSLTGDPQAPGTHWLRGVRTSLSEQDWLCDVQLWTRSVCSRRPSMIA